ncbi:Slit-like protein 1 protein [Armadillidium vulgare]|nr:Slit-like protein 1 protein [Armadillidium vulgare]
MWLILVGLTLLAGDALSQANKIINSETDLIALESDQLIHSSAELLALEDQNKGLPFGARLPGYEKPLFAYSYTIKDGENDHNTNSHFKDVKFASLHNFPIDHSSESSENVIYLHDLNIIKQNKSNDFSDKNTTDDQTTTKELTHIKENIPQNPEIDSKLLKLETKNEKVKTDINRNEIILNTQHLLSTYLTPPKKNEIKIPTLDYLPPKEEIHSSGDEVKLTNKFLDQEYLPPAIEQSFIPKTTLDYLPPETPKPLTPKLEKKGSPSTTSFFIAPESLSDSKPDSSSASEQSFIPNLTLDYLPPEAPKPLTPKLEQSYLPPEEKKGSSSATSFFIAPESLLDIKSDSSPETLTDSLNVNYLPPNKNLNDLNLVSDIRDKQTYSTKESSSVILNESYLPPQKNLNSKPSLDLSYLPPEKNEKSTASNVLHSVKSNFEYFQPDENKADDQIIFRKENISPIIPIGISRTLLPPSIPFTADNVKKSALTIDNEKLSPGLVSVSVLLPPQPDFDNKKPVYSDENVKDIVASDGTVGLEHSVFVLNSPIGIKRTKNHLQKEKLFVPSSNVEIIPHVDLKPSPSYKQKISQTSTDVDNPPIGLRRKESNIIPDVITEEIKDEPIHPTSEVKENLPFAVFFKHKDEPVRVLKDNVKTIPTVHFPNNRYNELIDLKKQKQTPEVSYSEFINEPIHPVATFNKISLADSRDQVNYIQSPVKDYSLVASNLNYKLAIDQPIHPKKKITPVTIGVESEPTLEYKKEIKKAPIAEYKKRIPESKIIPQSQYDKTPISVANEISEEKLLPSSSVKTIQNYVVQSESPIYECISNAECEEEEVCQNGRCIFGCSLALDLCIGEASCETRHHVPACVCPLMSTAKTVYKSGYLQFDCVPMIKSASSKIITEYSRERLPSRFNTFSCFVRYPIAPLRPISPISGFHQRPIVAPVRTTATFVQTPITHSTAIRGSHVSAIRGSGNPCSPSPCGPNTRCDVNSNGIAQCRCIDDYVPDVPEVRAPPDLPVDPCVPNPCGTNADCRERGDRAVCSCPIGYEGNPLTNCIKGECIGHDDCPNHLACQALRCIDPCAGVCGSGSECTVRNHQPVCSCPRNHIGDPFSSCRRITEYDVCNPTPCGQNTNCKAKYERDGGLRAVCSCIDNYIGSPLTGCRPECVRDTDCSPNQHCKDNRCRNPCVDGCGEGSYCDVRNHRAVCSCPEHFLGDPYSRCYTECTAHEDCPEFEACNLFQCINPCEGACGSGADCKVENHTPICSCPRGYTGDPFVSCRAFTLDDLCRDNPCGSNAECHPGKDRSGNDRPVCTCPRGYIGNPLISCRKGECEVHDTCPDHQACYGYLCQSPCVTETGSVCGENADCKVKNHTPVCSCPRGYNGNPLEECRISPSARIAGRSHRKQ